MNFQYIHSGYYRAESDITGDSYVIRTRPLGDGWMSIAESEGYVLATGQSIRDAKATCERCDKGVAKDMTMPYTSNPRSN